MLAMEMLFTIIKIAPWIGTTFTEASIIPRNGIIARESTI